MIDNYKNFLLEKEFKSILDDIFSLNESEGRWVNDRQYVWDFEPAEKESVVDKSLEKLKNFIQKLDKEQIKIYYTKLVNRLKKLSGRIRKFLLTHYTSVFLTIVSLSYLIGGGDSTTTAGGGTGKMEQIDPEIKQEIIDLHQTSSFEVAQSSVKEVEAGYSDDRSDNGNWVEVPGFGKRFIGTNHGISAPVLQQHLGRIPKREDMENLSYETAVEIYKKDYWNAQNLSYLCNQSVANIIYDGCVNQGVDGMTEVIKKAAAEQGTNLTGSVYKKSNIRRLNSLNQKELFDSIKKFREARYKSAETWSVHGEGWLNRLNSIEYQNLS